MPKNSKGYLKNWSRTSNGYKKKPGEWIKEDNIESERSQ
jgi:hypothetical protein